MTSSTRIVVDEDDPEIDIEAPPFSPRPEVKPRKDKDFTDEFKVIDFLGRGKFGEVKRCRELATGREFAAKFIATPRPQDRKDVEHEIATMRRLHHRRLVQLYDAFESKKEMCLILEIVYGGELFDRAISEDFLLTEKACVCILRQICEGVDYIHSQNIIHLDMKPENILCMSKTSNRIKIIDFGLARDYNPKVDTRVLFGTPEFMAPEVVQYDPIDFSTDMWSIGVICYVLLSGLSPFMGDNDADTLSNVIKGRYSFDYNEFREVSLEAKDMISKLLVIDKKKRLSARDCLNHSWLKKIPKPTTPNLDLSKIQLKHYVYRRKWQKAINALIALRRMGCDIRTLTTNNNETKKFDNWSSSSFIQHPHQTVAKINGSCSSDRQLSRQPQQNVPGVQASPALSTQPPTSSSAKVQPLPTLGSDASQRFFPPSTTLPPVRLCSSSVDQEVIPSAVVAEDVTSRKSCHRAADAAEHFGNGHVFNLSKMIQLNKQHHVDELTPAEKWHRDFKGGAAAGGLASATLGRLNQRQQQQQVEIFNSQRATGPTATSNSVVTPPERSSRTRLAPVVPLTLNINSTASGENDQQRRTGTNSSCAAAASELSLPLSSKSKASIASNHPVPVSPKSTQQQLQTVNGFSSEPIGVPDEQPDIWQTRDVTKVGGGALNGAKQVPNNAADQRLSSFGRRQPPQQLQRLQQTANNSKPAGTGAPVPNGSLQSPAAGAGSSISSTSSNCSDGIGVAAKLSMSVSNGSVAKTTPSIGSAALPRTPQAGTMTAPATTAAVGKEPTLIRDRVKFFNRSNDASGTVPPPTSNAKQQPPQTSTPTKSSWFSRNNLFK